MLDLGKKQGKWYVNKKSNHAKNEVIVYSKKSYFIIAEQVQGGVKGE